MPDRAYADADVLISYLGRDEDRLADIEAFLDRAVKGEIEIVTSTISVVEVAFVAAEKKNSALDPAEEQRIDELWYPRSPVKLVDFHEGIARRARGFKRIAMENGWALRTMDAIHLATADSVNAVELDTYNAGDFAKFSPHVRLRITAPTGGQMPLPTDGDATAQS